MEVEWVAEMLSTFDGYRLIPNADKVNIFFLSLIYSINK